MNERELGAKAMGAILAGKSVITADTPQEAIDRVLAIIDGEISHHLSHIATARRRLEGGTSWKSIAAQCGVNRERYGNTEASVEALRDLRRRIASALLLPALESQRDVSADE